MLYGVAPQLEKPMIIRPRPGVLQLFFVMRGSIVPRIAPQIIGFGLYSTIVVAALKRGGLELGSYGLAPFTLLGVTLSIYLVFRNNAAYDRWWEARRLWGQLIVDTRNLARVVIALVPAASGQGRPLLMEALAFAHLLRGQLRNVDAGPEARAMIDGELDRVLEGANRPDAVIRAMGRRLGELKSSAAIGAIEFRILDERLCSLSGLLAGCERLAGTPLPFAYTLLLHRSAYLFCLLLPFGLVSSAGWYSGLFTAFVAYSFFGLDALSEELEEPFGVAENDLALDSLCRVCEIAVFEALGEVPPKVLPPHNHRYT